MKTDGIRPKTIVARAQLDPRTTRYVLDGSTDLAIPRAAGQGRPRAFTLDEAVRLATCTRLVMFGVPLDVAEDVVAWCEREVRPRTRDHKTLRFLYDSHVMRPWTLTLINGRYLRMDRQPRRDERESWVTEDDVCYDAIEERKVHLLDIPAHLPRIQWSMTDLGFELAKD